jgi:TrmH family RNA methyltransferase
MKITEHPTITSKDNARLKFARAVRDGRDRSAIFVEGKRLVSELLRSPLKPLSVFISEESNDRYPELVDELFRNPTGEIYFVASRVFESIADTENSQGIIVLANRPKPRALETEKAADGLFVYLKKVNNPSNLGAVLRTAEASGAVGIITSPGSTDPYMPKALRASMGSAFRMPVFTNIELADAIRILKGSGIRAIAADINGTKSYAESDWRGGRMLVLGSEAEGLEAEELGLVDETVVIPMENGVESLNLAVSAGIVLFEAKRQRAGT